MRFEQDADYYVALSGALPRFESGSCVVLALLEDSEARQWASAAELAKLRAMLASTLLFARHIATIELELRNGSAPAGPQLGGPALGPAPGLPSLPPSTADGGGASPVEVQRVVLRRSLGAVRTVTHEVAPRPSGGLPLFAVTGKLEVARLTLRMEYDSGGGGGGASRAASIELTQVKGDLEVRKEKGQGRNVDALKNIARQLGKAMPERTALRLIYPSAAGDSRAQNDDGGGAPMAALQQALDSLRCAAGDGRVYIGIGRTDQTMGGGFHVCGAFLPTMERVTIDLADRDMALWNRELLGAAAALASDYFMDEERSLSSRGLHSFLGGQAKVKVLKRKGAAAPADDGGRGGGGGGGGGGGDGDEAPPPPQEPLTPRLAALLQAHTFVRTTPNGRVQQIVASAFLAHVSDT